MREERTKVQLKNTKQKQKLQHNTHPLSPLSHPVINQHPSPNPSFVITIQRT